MESVPLNTSENHDLLRFSKGVCCWICLFPSLRYFKHLCKSSDFRAPVLPTRHSFSKTAHTHLYIPSWFCSEISWADSQLFQETDFSVTKWHTNSPIWCYRFLPSPSHLPLTPYHPVYRQIFPWKFLPHLISAVTLRNEPHNLKMHSFQFLTGSSDIIIFLPSRRPFF